MNRTCTYRNGSTLYDEQDLIRAFTVLDGHAKDIKTIPEEIELTQVDFSNLVVEMKERNGGSFLFSPSGVFHSFGIRIKIFD